MSRQFDVVIVGGGVIGLAAACLLAARKVCEPGRVAVIADRWAPPAAADAELDLRVFALGRAAERLLRQCKVWELLPPARVFAYERMCVWDAGGVPGGRGSLSFDCAEIDEPNLGTIVEGRALQWHCLEAARAAGVVLIEASPESLATTDADVRVTLSDGRELVAKLLVAADGTQSKTRALLGIGTAGHSYQQDALVAHVRTGKPHRNTAWQRFLAGGPLAFLPLPDGRSSIVWSVARDEAARLRSLDADGFAAALTEAAGDVLGRCELSTAVASFPLQLQYALDYVRPRAVLLGDAAHVVHPLAGQGLNLGLLDCAALCESLEGGGDIRGIGDQRLLRRYERRRRSENLLAAAALDGLERVFSSGNTALAAVRSAGLGAVGGLPFIKRQFARHALGLSGDVPAFLKSTVDPPWPRR
jgi:ubiquinone biosynthesis UbiH/UbiF/VisC/COQ6 family hydroxylase